MYFCISISNGVQLIASSCVTNSLPSLSALICLKYSASNISQSMAKLSVRSCEVSTRTMLIAIYLELHAYLSGCRESRNIHLLVSLRLSLPSYLNAGGGFTMLSMTCFLQKYRRNVISFIIKIIIRSYLILKLTYSGAGQP